MKHGFSLLLPSQRLAVCLILLTGLVDAIGLTISPLQFDPDWNEWALTGVVIAGLIVCLKLHQLDLSAPNKHFITNLVLLTLFSPLGLVLSYLVASHSGAPLDDCLIRIDSNLGFDWQAYHAFFLQNGYLRGFSFLFYLLVPILPVVS